MNLPSHSLALLVATFCSSKSSHGCQKEERKSFFFSIIAPLMWLVHVNRYCKDFQSSKRTPYVPTVVQHSINPDHPSLAYLSIAVPPLLQSPSPRQPVAAPSLFSYSPVPFGGPAVPRAPAIPPESSSDGPCHIALSGRHLTADGAPLGRAGQRGSSKVSGGQLRSTGWMSSIRHVPARWRGCYEPERTLAELTAVSDSEAKFALPRGACMGCLD